MAFKELADLDADTCYALGGKDKKTGKNNPTKVEGYFIGTRQVESKKSKTGLAALHIIQTSKGNVGIWGKTNLDQKLKSVTPGVMVKIEFSGMKETKNNPMYVYKVSQDTENTIEVVGADTSAAADTGSDDQGDFNSDDTPFEGDTGAEDDVDADSDAPAADEPPPQRAQAPRRPAAAPTRAATQGVQGLLANRRRSA